MLTETPLQTADPTNPTLAERYGDALCAAESARANSIIREALASGLEPEAVQAFVIAPAMHWIGELWARNTISVADEHLATAISYGAIAELYPALVKRGEERHETVIVCAVEGEHHVLGARMAADVLEGAGFETLFLGADVPTPALGVAVAGHKADVVCLSLHMPLGAARLERAIAAVQDASPGVRVLLAGRGVPARLREQFPYVAATTELLATVDDALLGPEQPRVTVSQTIEPQFEIEPAPLEAKLADATAQVADLARENARQAEQFRQLAFEDLVTRLPNRRALEDRLGDLHSHAEPSLLVLDIDGFRLINDTFGHLVGDEALRRVADLMRSALRPHDFIARVGGDEFVAVLASASPYEAACVAERLRATVEEDEAEPRLTVSVGIAQYHGDVRAAVLEADQALYAAKRAGRNTVARAA